MCRVETRPQVGEHAGMESVPLKAAEGGLVEERKAFLPQSYSLWKDSIEGRLWSLLTLFGLFISSPFLFAFVALSVLSAVVRKLLRLPAARKLPEGSNKGRGRTALVTGGKMTKSLDVCRHLKNEGFRVILTETPRYWMSASRFSSAVDKFVVLPVAPETHPEGYVEALRNLFEKENVSLFAPVCSPFSSLYDAKAAESLPEGAISWSLPAEMVQQLDDKVEFARMAKEVGLPVPDTLRVESKEEVRRFNSELAEKWRRDSSSAIASGAEKKKTDCRRYILKTLDYDPMRRLDLFTLPCGPKELEKYLDETTISPDRPWLVQEFLEGREYSSCALSWKGKLLAFTDNEAVISCYNFKYAGRDKIQEWVRVFCEKYQLSGVICVDFFERADGTQLAIECNPRFSSNMTAFYNNPRLGAAMADPDLALRSGVTETPLPSSKESNWTLVDLYFHSYTQMMKNPLAAFTAAAGLLLVSEETKEKQDAYWAPEDPLPSLALHCFHMPALLVRNVWDGRKWAKIDFCIGKMTEENGD
uniref:ATP-grasp domain-containing protein n=1 Tax=Chromera velia CCMP2878 TaxID=1169474 RepID=A0A0G4HZ53_9ALVE|mmetsp:Transcript_6252/g.12344  ORF Transcript_6252/g.12344 Transcript_6252/m.12344 type:complete len:531 (+) Transcript_6252:153-1745(+)|eukprot:Cvel_9647.t1-p1 / transcript=Cvel_9647.t1 / gene=Cvel_9647 / organism=Chromera_velia_CCMP2878 / gene_product=hypothetical protein / transcript_product=hypothetical protein / location=Cvel_scaffold561:31179-33445(+) / protein_length=530 / sequence_SO=supercontig / SO=protein_coding / is_pseudo=false